MALKTGERLWAYNPQELEAEQIGTRHSKPKKIGWSKRKPDDRPVQVRTYESSRVTGDIYGDVVIKYQNEIRTLARDKVRNGGRKSLLVNKGLRDDADTVRKKVQNISENSASSVIRTKVTKPRGMIDETITQRMTFQQAIALEAGNRAARSTRAIRRGVAAGLAVAAVFGVYKYSGGSELFDSVQAQFADNNTQTADNPDAYDLNNKSNVKAAAYGAVMCKGTAKFNVTPADMDETHPALSAMERALGSTSVDGFDYVDSLGKKQQRNFLNTVSDRLNGGEHLNQIGTFTGPINCAEK